MGMLQEFKDFAVKGNAVDMAVGVVIGAAFGKIVTSVVEDLIMPPLGMFMGGTDFTNLFFTLDGSDFSTLLAAKEAGAPVVGYGSFIQTAINFLIIAFAVFMMVKAMNKATAAAAPEEVVDETPPEPSEDVLLLREIRDSLAASVNKLAETHAVIEATASKVPAALAGAAVAAAAGVVVADVEPEAEPEPEAAPVEEEKPAEEEPKPDDGIVDEGGWIDD